MVNDAKLYSVRKLRRKYIRALRKTWRISDRLSRAYSFERKDILEERGIWTDWARAVRDELHDRGQLAP